MTARSFKKDDVVWGKIQGYPWWPAVVAGWTRDQHQDPDPDPGPDQDKKQKRGRSNEKGRKRDKGTIKKRGGRRLVVNFIGEKKHGVLPRNKVVGFEELYEMHAKTGKKRLLKAIALAKNIVETKSRVAHEASSKICPAARGKRARAEQQSEECGRTEQKELRKRRTHKTAGRQEHNFLARFVSYKNSNKMLAGVKQAAKCLKVIAAIPHDPEVLFESRLGLLLRQLVDKCARHTELAPLSELAQQVLDQLKDETIENLFGKEPKADRANAHWEIAQGNLNDRRLSQSPQKGTAVEYSQ